MSIYPETESGCPCLMRKDIMIVDDNVFNILTLQTILESLCNLQTDKALNGREAIDKIISRQRENEANPCICRMKRANYKLIFMDCNMPIVDGFEAT